MTTAITEKQAVTGALAFSAAAFAFLIWLIYFKAQPETYPDAYAALPAVNAALNAMSACAVLAGLAAIKSGNKKLHMSFMVTAFAFSAAFLVCYIIYHNVHGDTPFLGEGAIRNLYFFVLISHIAVTAVALPLILMTFFLAATKRFDRHKRFARITFPLWLYVSVTGVAIYFMLKAHS